MATVNSLEDIFKQNQYNLKDSMRKSSDWFEQQAKLMAKQGITPKKALKGEHMSNNLLPGNLYMFFYDPKYKETLPYYDRFPMVFPYEKTQDGFKGLNMHYLPYQLRVKLLDRLLQFRNNTRMDETTRLKYSWSLIGGVTKFKAAEPCIKHYLFNHVQSSFKMILPQDWATAMMLPVEVFVGASKQRVWQDSKRLITT
jgi:hypothetical protein